MKCETAEKQMLLARSGELDDAALAALELHVNTCESCAACWRDLEELEKLAVPLREPTSDVIAGVLADAERGKGSGILHFHSPVMRVLAYAAALVIAAGGWFTVSHMLETKSVPQPSLTEYAGDLGALVAVAMHTSEDAADEISDEDASEAVSHNEAMARWLLELEGFSMEQYSEAEEAINQLSEQTPTALQSNSSPAPLLKRCV